MGESEAVVSLKPGIRSLPRSSRYCVDKLAKYKRPRFIQIVDDIPQSGRQNLKTEVRKLYGQA